MRAASFRCLVLVAVALTASCARPVGIAEAPEPRLQCRIPTASGDAPALNWLLPDDTQQRATLDRWCRTVGPPVLAVPKSQSPEPVRRVAVVSWNTHVGQGDLVRLLDDLRSGLHTSAQPDAVVLLLQEVRRSDPDVPVSLGSGAPIPGRIGPAAGAPPALDIVAASTRGAWHLAYVPSMRNGVVQRNDQGEDRGSAILSSHPLTDLQAIELPMERQRRVAIAATIVGVTPSGRRWRLRLVNVHLENRPGGGRLWVRAAAARTRQVETLLDALDLDTDRDDVSSPCDDEGLVIGGDLNTWRGESEGALQLLRRAMPATTPEDPRPTMGRMRLDYLFVRAPCEAQPQMRRLDDTYGSDHHPVLVEIDFGAR